MALDEETRERDWEYLQKIVAELSEHYECVQVFVANTIEGETIPMTLGSGNFYARQGQIQAWLNNANIENPTGEDSSVVEEDDEDEKGFST